MVNKYSRPTHATCPIWYKKVELMLLPPHLSHQILYTVGQIVPEEDFYEQLVKR